MDSLTIVGLEVPAHIGVRPWERQVRQLVTVDLELGIDASRAAAADDLGQALDYGNIARRVTAHIAESRAGLIETLAESIATLVLRELGATRVRVRVHKPGAIPNARGVMIEIERGSVGSA